MLSSKNKIKDDILHDAIRTALDQRKVIDIQKAAIVALIGCIVFLLARKEV